MWNGENHMVLDQYWEDEEAKNEREAIEAAKWEHAADAWDDRVEE